MSSPGANRNRVNRSRLRRLKGRANWKNRASASMSEKYNHVAAFGRWKSRKIDESTGDPLRPPGEPLTSGYAGNEPVHTRRGTARQATARRDPTAPHDPRRRTPDS